LRVPAFSSVLSLSRQNLETAKLGKQLGVVWLVECRVVQEDGRLQLTANLVDVATDDSEPFIDLELEAIEVFTVLDTATQSLVEKLGVSLTAGERARLMERHTDSTRALDAWLKGEQAMRKGTADGYREARQHFQDAQIAGDFELAHVSEADAMMRLMEAEAAVGEKATATLNAVGLILDEVEGKNPIAELYAARMRLAALSADPSAGPDRWRDWFERAVELKPSYAVPYRLLGEHLARAGLREEAAELLERAKALDPAGAQSN
jgi:tetratricopeptide (TPR) repeat protein